MKVIFYVYCSSVSLNQTRINSVIAISPEISGPDQDH